MLRDTMGDEVPGRRTVGGDHLRLTNAGDDFVHLLLSELRAMETQLVVGSERLEESASRINQLQSLVDSLKGEAACAQAERERGDNLFTQIEGLQRSIVAVEAALDATVEQRDAYALEARLVRAELDAWIVECESLLEQSDTLTFELKSFRETFATAQSARAGTEQQLALLTGEIDAERAAARDLLRCLEQAQAKLAESELRANETDAALAAKDQRICELITHGEQTSKHIAELMSRLAEVATERENLQRQVHDLKATVAALHVTEAEAAENAAEAEQLRVELQHERATQDAIFSALESVEHASRSTEDRITELLLSRATVEQQRDEYRCQIEDLRVRLSESQQHVGALDTEVLESAKRVRQLQSQLDSECANQEMLIAALQGAEQAARNMEAQIAELVSGRSEIVRQRNDLEFQLASTQNRLANFEAESAKHLSQIADHSTRAKQLQSELEAERLTQDSLVAALQGAEHAARSMEARIADLLASRAQIAHERDDAVRTSAGLERKILQLESHVAESEHYVRDLLWQLEERSKQISEGEQYARRLERELGKRERDNDTLKSQLEITRKAALSEKAVMREYIDSLKQQAAEIPQLRDAQRLLVTHAEEVTASIQVESEQITMLIDTVQSSHFWKFKRLLNRMRSRVRRR